MRYYSICLRTQKRICIGISIIKFVACVDFRLPHKKKITISVNGNLKWIYCKVKYIYGIIILYVYCVSILLTRICYIYLCILIIMCIVIDYITHILWYFVCHFVKIKCTLNIRYRRLVWLRCNRKLNC